MADSITPERFIRVWQTSPDCATVGKRLKMNLVAARGRARFYRANGVPLKKMSRAGAKRGSGAIEWKPLIDLARSLG